ncbi:helix-turn-helix domain-containing protein [Reyranella sp.]|uniref:helix-turn-helix domain-containing protein n=1 Tax=Reyranella sp. TaxID=1929291 RepID=UPI003D0BEFD7
MAVSRTLTFAEPDQYQSALRAVEADVIVNGKGRFHARVTHVNFSRLWLQSGSDNLPRIARLANDPSRAPIFLQTHSSQAPIIIAGKEISPSDLIVFRNGETHINRSMGPSSWGAMSLDPEALADAGRVIAGRELTFPPNTYSTRPPPELLSRLTYLHRRAIQLAAEGPERLGHPEVARSLEHDMVHLMVRCIIDQSGSDDRIGNFRHKAIIQKFEELAVANPHRPLHLAEVCAATGATERTLLRCCHEQFGMGPIRFLWLRRMNMVRAALARADASSSNVTKVATAHGFWELGRFAVSYRRIYGESPSRTLARTSACNPLPSHPVRFPGGHFPELAGTA